MYSSVKFPTAREGDTLRPVSVVITSDREFVGKYLDILPLPWSEIAFMAIFKHMHAAGVGLVRAGLFRALGGDNSAQTMEQLRIPPFSFAPDVDLLPTIDEFIFDSKKLPNMRKAVAAGKGLILLSHALKNTMLGNLDAYKQPENGNSAKLHILADGANMFSSHTSGILMDGMGPDQFIKSHDDKVTSKFNLNHHDKAKIDSWGLTIETQGGASELITTINAIHSMHKKSNRIDASETTTDLPAISIAHACSQMIELLPT